MFKSFYLAQSITHGEELVFFTSDGITEIPSGCYYNSDLTTDIRKAHRFNSLAALKRGVPQWKEHTIVITQSEVALKGN